MEVASGTVVDGRYRVLNRIGSGGMADVYHAEDAHLGRAVALKVLHRRFARDTEFVERFRREASAAAGLQHANVVNVFDRGEHDGTYYIAMEHLPGRTLKQVIAEDAPLDQERAIDLGIQILRGAGFAHQRGIVHRDLKPHNAIVDSNDRVKVTDFGIARAGASEMTETGSIMGTAQYLSPEQAQGHGTSAQSDIYSVGVVLYEMLSGTVPFEGDSAVAIALKHVNEAPPPLHAYRPDIHPALEQAVMAALAKNAAHRYASTDDFILALEDAGRRIAAGEDGPDTIAFAPVAGIPEDAPDPTRYQAYPEADGVPAPPEERSRRWATVLIVLLLVALVGAVAYALTRPEQVEVPDAVGEQLVDARVQLERRGFEVEVERVQDVAPVDRVISQDPAGGEEAGEGSTIELTVSNGPGERVVPSVEGLPERRAIRELNEAGFKVTVDEEPSRDVRRGTVTRTSPEGGDRAEVGSRIRVFVSSGPERVRVPDVVGITQGSAESRIEADGLTAVVEREESEEPEGEVVRQSPAAGTSAREGDRVTIVVSTGPGTEEVPSVVGLTTSQARSELSGAGFRVAVRQRSTSDEAEDGIVLEQRPGPGSEERSGRTVTIFVGRFEAPPEPEPETGAGTPPAPAGRRT